MFYPSIRRKHLGTSASFQCTHWGSRFPLVFAQQGVYHGVSRRLTTSHMPVKMHGMQLYRIGEALETAGVSRATYFRWVKTKRIPDTRFKDRNGRRVFTAEEVQELQAAAQRLISSPEQLRMPMEHWPKQE
jgi:hypothetical protein